MITAHTGILAMTTAFINVTFAPSYAML